jgi:hypothetical protein
MDRQDSFPIGSIECTVLSDGWGDYPPEAIFPGVPEERWRPFAGTSLTEEGMIRLAYQQLLLRSGERLALVDAGLGDFGGPDGSAGRLPGSLAGLGISPDDIDLVLVSHAHPDHIGGLVRLGGPAPVPAFPNARVVMRQDEFEFWTSDASASMMEVMREVTGTVLPPSTTPISSISWTMTVRSSPVSGSSPPRATPRDTPRCWCRMTTRARSISEMLSSTRRSSRTRDGPRRSTPSRR